MRKCFFHNRLRSIRSYGDRRKAFSLAELVVAIGILLLMLSLVGQVFNTTIESTGHAMALTEVGQLLRAFERTVRDDLRGVQPGQSMILIQSNPVNAYWTVDGKAADDPSGDPSDANGYPHIPDPVREHANGNMIMPRADILMFITARRGASYVFTNPPVTASLQQVVYGHAKLGEYVPAPAGSGPPYRFQRNQLPEMFPVDDATGYPATIKVAPVPASQWHLARRGVLLVSTPPPPPPPPPDVGWIDALALTGTPKPDKGLSDPAILRGQTDVVGNFNDIEWVQKPGETTAPWFQPAIFDGGVFGQDSPYERSQLDPTPPAAYGDRLGHYLLPNCASFKVEWALDSHGMFVSGRLDGEKQVYWFDPGDPQNPLGVLEIIARPPQGEPPLNLSDLLDNRETYHPDGDQYSLAERFRGPTLEGIPPNEPWVELGREQRLDDLRPNLILFGASRRDINDAADPLDDEIVDEDIFPVALRITIDVFDREGRLDRPIRHVIVVPVGG